METYDPGFSRFSRKAKSPKKRSLRVLPRPPGRLRVCCDLSLWGHAHLEARRKTLRTTAAAKSLGRKGLTVRSIDQKLALRQSALITALLESQTQPSQTQATPKRQQ